MLALLTKTKNKSVMSTKHGTFIALSESETSHSKLTRTSTVYCATKHFVGDSDTGFLKPTGPNHSF
jgi:NADP-dependent 3-hydroxy acid dehydrogenase YdfG